MRRSFLIFLSVILFVTGGILSGCSDSNNKEKQPVVVEVQDSTMVINGWKWAINLDNHLRILASPDSRNRGYFALIDDMDGYDAIFMFDDKCKLSQACINLIWYYFFYQENTLHVSYRDNAIWRHHSFNFQSTSLSGTNAFERITANLKTVCQTVSFLPKPVGTNINDLFAAVSNRKYNTSSAQDDDTAIQDFCKSVFYYETSNPTLRHDLFDTDTFVHYTHERTAEHNQVGIMVSPIYNTTFNRGYDSGNYGEEIENKVYCGLLFSTSPDPTVNKHEYISDIVPLEPVDNYVWVDVPDELEDKTYYIRAFMVSEQEKAKVEQGEYIHPHLAYYEDGVDGMELFYGGEAQINNIKAINESVYNRQLTVNLSGDLSLSGYLSEALQGKAIELRVRPVGQKSYEYLNQAEQGKINGYIHMYRQDFKEVDLENYIARSDWELAIYAGWVCIGVKPFTIIYDKKPAIYYSDLTSDGTTVTYKKTCEGALWFDGDIKSIWEYSNGTLECSSAFANDTEYEQTVNIDDSGLISHQLKTTGEYMQSSAYGQEIKSNRLIYIRNSEGKRTDIRLVQ